LAAAVASNPILIQQSDDETRANEKRRSSATDGKPSLSDVSW
jgi:hypothetical protein